MANIYKGSTGLVGNTPLVELVNIEKDKNLKARVLVKLEYFNPAGSVKDRIAKAMIEAAEKEGKLKEGSVIIEPTSGNTGIGLASVAASKGYRVILTMPETMSVERRNMLKIYGAEVELTEGSKGMKGSIARAQELAESIENSFIPSQFANPVNPKIHEKTTGPEIWNDTDGEVDIFISGELLSRAVPVNIKPASEKKKKFYKNDFFNKLELSRQGGKKVIAVEPQDSAVLSGAKPGPHKIQGIGAGFIPDTLDVNVYDEIAKVSNESAFEYAKYIAKREGLLVGISSGAALSVAVELALKEENKGKTIVALLPDSGDRYFSTALFSE